MRDKNLNHTQFNIQLEKFVIKQIKQLDDRLLRTAVADSPKCLIDQDRFKVSYPRDFAGMRSIAIVLWSFPEELQWRVRMDLEEMTFSQFNDKQKLELSILLASKELCYFYLFETERYTARELFGNILGNELRIALRQLRIKEVTPPRPVRVQRHRGYRDKGSLRPSHRWLERFDYTLTEIQSCKEKKSDLQHRTATRLKQLLTEKLLFLEEDQNGEDPYPKTGKD